MQWLWELEALVYERPTVSRTPALRQPSSPSSSRLDHTPSLLKVASMPLSLTWTPIVGSITSTTQSRVPIGSAIKTPFNTWSYINLLFYLNKVSCIIWFYYCRLKRLLRLCSSSKTSVCRSVVFQTAASINVRLVVPVWVTARVDRLNDALVSLIEPDTRFCTLSMAKYENNTTFSSIKFLFLMFYILIFSR